MKSITVNQFIAFWAPKHIKNKILQYLLVSILNDNYQITSFRFGDKKYSTTNPKYLKDFLPFRKDSFILKYNIPLYSIFNSVNQHRQNVCAIKTMTTIVSEDDISKIDLFVKEMKSKKVASRIEKDPDEIRTYINSKNVYTKTIHYFKYINKMEIVNFNSGLILNEHQLIYACHLLDNSGRKSRFSLYNKPKNTILSISPLHMLWRISCGQIYMKELKELAKINKIKGRSKLVSRADYIAAFMKL